VGGGVGGGAVGGGGGEGEWVRYGSIVVGEIEGDGA